MHKSFDITTKQIVDVDPLAMLRFLGLPGAAARLIDTDLSIAVQADRLIEITDPDYIFHLEMQAGYDPGLGDRTHYYHVATRHKYKKRVVSLVVLLRRSADGPLMTGVLSDPSFTFRYQIVRIWEIRTDEVLAGPLTLLPFAPITNVKRQDLPGVIRRMKERIDEEADEAEKVRVWSTTSLLMGLNYSRSFVQGIFKGVWNMQESSVYQGILADGRAQGKAEGLTEGERRSLLRLGTKRLGEPDAETRAALESITSLQRLDELTDRLLDVETWRDLLEI